MIQQAVRVMDEGIRIGSASEIKVEILRYAPSKHVTATGKGFRKTGTENKEVAKLSSVRTQP